MIKGLRKNKGKIMKKTILIASCLCAFLFAASPVLTQGGDRIFSKNTADNHKKELLVRITVGEREKIQQLINRHITIQERHQDYIIVRVQADQIPVIESLALKYEIILDDASREIELLAETVDIAAFHNYQDVTDELAQAAIDHPDITYLTSYGQSVQGREIWAIKITDNPEVEEDEPEVRIVGAHHGNELMSVEIPLEMVHYLTDNYGSDPYVTSLVNEREIWIVPLVNPDGREAYSRYNANGYDLNRNYGYMWESGWNGGTGPFSEPETKAIRQLSIENNFVLSLSFHTSGDVINYVWNYSPNPTPDESLIKYLSEGYGSYNTYWVTNGWDWYETHGDTNDFSFGCRSDMDWTIEVANSNFTAVWNANRDAILYMIDMADMGVRGVVTDARTGSPLEATVEVVGIRWPYYTDPAAGDYHRPLLPGTYDLKFSANGYTPTIVTQVIVGEGAPAVVNVQLRKGKTSGAYNVVSCTIADPYNSHSNVTQPVWSLGAPDGKDASLGVAGNIVLDMGSKALILDKSGDDLKVHEGQPANNEGYSVFGSNSYSGPWTAIGNGNGTTSFDLAGTSLASVRYVKIVDDGDGNPNESRPGFDLNAVENLHSR